MTLAVGGDAGSAIFKLPAEVEGVGSDGVLFEAGMYDAAEDGAVDLAMFAEDESPEHEAEVGVADAGLFL